MPGDGVPALRGAARDLYDLLTRLRAEKASSSLRQIASKADISPGYLSEILAGKKTPHADVAERLAAALGADDRGTRTARWYADRARAEETMPVPEPDRPYRLESWLPAARQPLGEASPSRLLATASAIVPFFGRETELRRLTEWSDDRAHAMAAMLVHGPGGQGKTRLVQQFAGQLADWTVVQARHRMEPLPRTRPVSRNRISSGAGVLVVVDYAERWPIADLLALAQDPRLSAAGRCRLLLIARPAGGWWEVTRTRLRKLGLATSQLPLPSLALEPEKRREAFVAARDVFAREREMGVRDAHLVGVPAYVDEEPFAHALTLHMAALVAVDAHARNERSPDDPLAMSAYLLDRERDHWQSMYDKPAQALRTHPSTMARAVFTATVCGPQTYDDGLALLDTAGVGGQGNEVLDDHSIVYPPTADGTVLEPLVPDRLGEDFLALQTVGHGRGEYSGDPWATTAVERLLLGAGAGAMRSQRYAGRALTVLIEAAHRWPHLVPTHLNPVLGRAPQLLLLAGSAAMTRYADLPGIDMRVCEALESAFVAQRHIGLDSGIAAIVRRLTTGRAAEAADPADSARLGINLGWRLAMAGKYQEALSATESAVQQLRSLPQEDIDKQAPALAASLRNLGVWLANVGRAEEALRTCREARGIYERLAAAHPDLHTGDYATALSNEALRLFQLGRHDEATDAARRSVALHRQVVEREAAHTPFFAFSLINLAGMLRNRDVSEAVRVSTEGIEVARYAAALQPAAHTPTLAAALNTATGVLVTAGREAEAVAAAEEAVGLYRVAVGANPDAFSLKLVSSLTNLSSALAAAGRLDAALDAAEEGVATHRRTLDADPHAYDPNVSLPRGLAWLAELRAESGNIAEALDTAIESAKLTKGGTATDAVDHQSSLAVLLGSLAAETAGAGQPDKALPANVLRAELLRRLAEHDPDTYEADLAVALVNLGARAMELGDTAAAFGPWGEAADIRRRLVAADSVTHGASLRSALYNLAVAHARGAVGASGRDRGGSARRRGRGPSR